MSMSVEKRGKENLSALKLVCIAGQEMTPKKATSKKATSKKEKSTSGVEKWSCNL